MAPVLLLLLYRSLSFLIQALAVGCAVYFSIMHPLPFDADLQRKSIARGWPKLIVYGTRAFCHFTIVSAMALCMHLALHMFVGDEDVWWNEVRHAVFVVAHAFQTSVGVFYHALVWLNPFLLISPETFPKNPAYTVSQLFKFTSMPTSKRLIPLWFLLHVQHLMAPLTIWIELALFGTPHTNIELTLENELMLVLGALLAYGAFNLFSWAVRGIPPYPLQRELWQKSKIMAILFYITFAFATVFFAAIAREFRLWALIKGNEVRTNAMKLANEV